MTDRIEWGGTPGPWRGMEQGEANEFCLIGNERRWILSFRQNGELWSAEQMTNLRAIAQVPAMVAALRRLVDSAASLVDYHDDDETEAAIDGARAILAAIDGEGAA